MPTVEERLASQEEEVARLKAAASKGEENVQSWWKKIRGTFKDGPDCDEAMRLGRQWRDSFRPKVDIGLVSVKVRPVIITAYRSNIQSEVTDAPK